MTENRHLVVAAIALLFVNLQFADELDRPSQVLSVSEDKLIRSSVSENGPRISAGGLSKPFQRVLAIPVDVRQIFDQKPQPTLRLLLKIVEDGRAWDSIHASALITAFIDGPAVGAMGIPTSDDKWDDLMGGAKTETFRDQSRKKCERLIADFEKPKPLPKKD